MVRDPDALRIEKWAANGDVQTPEDRGLDRDVGWPADFSQPRGRQPTREVFNQLFREITAQEVEVTTRGLLPWDSRISYVHPAMVMGSNARPYLSVADSLGVDPITDSTGSSWLLLEVQGPPGPPGAAGSDANVPQASTSEAGKVELATGAETLARTETDKVVTPGALADSVLTAAPTDSNEDDKLVTWGVAKAAFLDADTPLTGWVTFASGAVTNDDSTQTYEGVDYTPQEYGAGDRRAQSYWLNFSVSSGGVLKASSVTGGFQVSWDDTSVAKRNVRFVVAVHDGRGYRGSLNAVEGVFHVTPFVQDAPYALGTIFKERTQVFRSAVTELKRGGVLLAAVQSSGSLDIIGMIAITD